MDEALLGRAREYAQKQGKSFNALVGEMLAREIDPDRLADPRAAWAEADRRGSRSGGPHPTREEIYAKRLERYPHPKD